MLSAQQIYRDPINAARNVAAIRENIPPEAAEQFVDALHRILPQCADPDMALNNLERLLAAGHEPVFIARLLENDERNLDSIVRLISISQFFADTLILDPAARELVCSPSRRNPSTEHLIAELQALVEAATDDSTVLRAFRRFRRLQTLRIGINDIIRDRPIEEITRELARVADASLKIAVQTALRTVARKYGTPTTTEGTPAHLAALAFGKLGGDELNYSSDIDLLFVYDDEGTTRNPRGQPMPNNEFFTRTITEVIRLLSAHTDHGFAYRVDLRLRPEGARGPLARTLASTLSYYDVRGRTWERQALIKVRAVAGDESLGAEFVRAIEPFVYRKYFSFSEINEVKSLKRRMEQRTVESGREDTDVKTGRGGIRDIEFTVQFLQLVNGGDLQAVRQRNTLLALEALEIAGCLTPEETYRLSDAYRFLRKTEHRLQLLFDWQTHKLPTSSDELHKLARRMGYQAKVATGEPRGEVVPHRGPLDEIPTGPNFHTKALLSDPLELFLQDYSEKTLLNRAILDHLLHQTFTDDAEGRSEPESDLILDREPEAHTIASVLGKYPFRDVQAAYQNLTRLAQEEVTFLSGRRCRHFLASIAPKLLATLAETPNPDEALNNLERVTASLGAKAVLYELFSFNPPCLRLYVDICANSPYLCSILTNNPGMIDELLDSLVLDQPRSDEDLRAELTALCRGALDPEPILHSFQDKELLRVGVQDLLGKAEIRQTTAELSAIADSILQMVFDLAEADLKKKHGSPPCCYAVIGLGKLGGREISYHSDLDLILIYEHEGTTPEPQHHHYFTELVQRAIRIASQSGPLGRLYAIDMRLRPTGKNGNLVLPATEFARYFAPHGGAQLWERQAFTRARVVRAEEPFRAQANKLIEQAILGADWKPEFITEIRTMRERLETAANTRNIKRGRGGLTDVEFLVQLLQLKYGRAHPAILVSNVWEALEQLHRAGWLDAEEFRELSAGYSFLRTTEARLRIVTDRPLVEIPEDLPARVRLARRRGFETGSPEEIATQFTTELVRIRQQIRSVFLAVLKRESASGT